MGLSGCMMQHSGASSKIKANESGAVSESDYSDCFKNLSPSGDFKNDKFSKVMFTQGACSGNSVAVVQLVESEFLVIVDEDGKESKSSLYADGNDIYVKKQDKTIVLGKITETGNGTEMVPNEGMNFGSDGSKITLTLTW